MSKESCLRNLHRLRCFRSLRCLRCFRSLAQFCALGVVGLAIAADVEPAKMIFIAFALQEWWRLSKFARIFQVIIFI